MNSFINFLLYFILCTWTSFCNADNIIDSTCSSQTQNTKNMVESIDNLAKVLNQSFIEQGLSWKGMQSRYAMFLCIRISF